MTGVHNFWGRVLLVVGLCVVGLIFPFVFILAAIVAHSIYSDVREAGNGAIPAPPPEIISFYDRESEYTWEKLSEYRTESVAEQAFLRAMIEAFQLKPAGEDLAGNGIRFAFQREILRYRVDFILNDWLIVEIDGAEWHSSPEAIERDGIRDAALRDLDYSILRIPAKTVFRTPGVAVSQVEAALTKPTTPISVIERDRRQAAAQKKFAAGMKTFNVLKSVGTAIDSVNEFVAEAQRSSTVTAALTNANITFEMERAIIENAISSAKRHFEREKEFNADPMLRELYEENEKRLKKIVNEMRKPKTGKFKISYVAPKQTGDVELDVAIGSGYEDLLKERNRYLDEISRAIRDKPVRSFVMNALIEKISGPTASEIATRHGESVFDYIVELGAVPKTR